MTKIPKIPGLFHYFFLLESPESSRRIQLQNVCVLHCFRGLCHWLESRSPPLSKQKKYNAHVFRPNGRGRANQGIPATHRGHCDRRGAAGSACYEGRRDRRRPEATGGDRRRPEATGGEARAKSRPF